MDNSSTPAFSNFVLDCGSSSIGFLISFAYIITRITLLVPLCTYVLYLGYQKWQQQHSFAKTSHSDIFTYHTFPLELNTTVGGILFLCGQYKEILHLTVAGMYFVISAIHVQICLHVLTCVERYLAVSHPVLYLALKQSGGILIRNISLVCVWLFAFVWAGLMTVGNDSLTHSCFFCLLLTSLIIMSFCSLRVLCVLIRPGPGEVGRNNVDQSKKRAFYTILVILALLWLWFVAFLIGLFFDKSTSNGSNTGCLVLITANWFSMPSCAILPLLFLQRAGKLACCRW